MKKDNFANAIIFLGNDSRLGQPFLDVSAAFVCNMDGSVVDKDEALQWLMPQFPIEPFDIGFRHWRGCFAVAGNACAPKDQGAVQHLTVSATVGHISKSLWVHGDRTWQKIGGAWQYSETTPFTKMPLDLTHAIGHKTWQQNPHGIGYYANAEKAYGQPVANVECVNQPMLSPDKPPVLGTFLPLPSGSPSYNQWLGTFDDKWLNQRAPWLPDDSDQRWYDRVSQDQCLPKETYWRGDEPWEATNMHEEHAELKGQLPGIRPRIFYSMKAEPELFSELSTVLDTVWLFPNDKRVVVIYRGHIQTKFEDAHDVERIGIFSEKMSAPKLPQSQYTAKWLEEIGQEVNGLLRPVAANGMLMTKALVAGATLASVALATGVAAKAIKQADEKKEQDEAVKLAAAKKQAEKKKLPKGNPEFEALSDAFDKGPEEFKKAMDEHFRDKFQKALDDTAKQIKDYGLEDLAKEHGFTVPTVDEVMARADAPNPEFDALSNVFDEDPEQLSQAMDDHFSDKFQTALDETDAQIQEYGLDDLAKENGFTTPSVDEVMARADTPNPELDALSKVFDENPDELAQAMDDHFRSKFQTALDDTAKQLKDYGLEDLAAENGFTMPTVDEVMARGK